MDLLTQFYVTVGLMIFSGGCGYYMGERGWSGVQIDLGNIKSDISHIQGKLGVTPTPQVTTATTITGRQASNTPTAGTTFSQ
jgi:hypothetical protein